MPLNANLKTPVKIIAFASAAFIAAGSAAAAESSDSVNFSYRKSELATNNGVSRLYERLQTKAESVCTVDAARTLNQRDDAKECAADLAEDWVLAINDRRLNRLAGVGGESRDYARR